MPETRASRKGPKPVEKPEGAPAAPPTADEKIDELAGMFAAFAEETRSAFNELAGTVATALVEQEKKLEAVGVGSVPNAEPAAAGHLPDAVLPFATTVGEGTIRFVSPHSSYRLVLEPGYQMVIENKPISVPQKWANFENGILDIDTTTDEGAAKAQAIMENVAYGTDFWVDPLALPRSGPEIVDGPRSTGSRPQAAQPRPEALSVKVS